MKQDTPQSPQQLEQELVRARKHVVQLEQRLGMNVGGLPVDDVFENHRDAVLYVDANTGQICWANLAAMKFYGYDRAELTSMYISDINVMNRDEVHAAIQQVKARIRSRFFFTHRLKNRELRSVEVYSVPVTLEGREMLCSFIRDLSGLTDTATSIERNAALQDLVLTSMDIVPFYCKNQAGYEPLYVGPSIMTVTGFAVERFYADSQFWASRIHANDKDKVVGRFKRLTTTGSTRCEYRWQVADGSYRWFSLSMRLVPCETDDPVGDTCITGLFWDITDRKRTEKALLEREERYRTVADFTHDWEFWIGPDGAFLYVSPSFERVTGYRPDELKRDPALLFDKIVHPLDRELVRTSILDGLLASETLSFDFRIVTRHGEVRWIGHVSQAVYDDKGDPLGRRASNRDITGLKETLKALRDKNQFIDAMMDNSPASIYAKDVDGRYLFGNAHFLKYTGKPMHEVMGKSDYGLFENALADRFRQSDRHVLETGESLFEEMELHHNGKLEHWTSTKFPLRNSEGLNLGVCGISLDVTKWREAEVSQRQLAQAVEQSPVSIAMTDTEGIIRSVNPYFCVTSGYTEEEILGRALGFMHADGMTDFYDSVWPGLLRGEDWHGEVRNRTKTGETLWESSTIAPVRDSQDRIINFVVVKEDITERKRLERLEKDVERIVRHDLKSPIMSFVWVPRMLRKAENITEEQAVLLRDMEQSAHRLLKMINISLDLFKMEEGTYHVVAEDLNIVRVIQNVLHDLQQMTQSLKVRVDVRIMGHSMADRDYLVVRGEELLCHSMLANVIKNAVEASEPGGVVTVQCNDGDMVSIRVHNETVVPEGLRETFFEKYSTAGKKFGTGLGTYSARLLAQTQGGTISMESSVETGTTIIMTLPSGGAS